MAGSGGTIRGQVSLYALAKSKQTRAMRTKGQDRVMTSQCMELVLVSFTLIIDKNENLLGYMCI